MKFLDFRKQISLEHNATQELVIKIISNNIELNHKKHLSIRGIKKQYYGDYYEPNSFSLWNSQIGVAGWWDKKHSTRVDVKINENTIDLLIDDANIFIPFFASTFFFVMGVSILIARLFDSSIINELTIAGIVLTVIPSIIFLIGKKAMDYAKKDALNFFNKIFSKYGHRLKIVH